MPKNSVGEPFSVSLFPGIEKFYASEGCHSFMSKFFCLTVPKNFEEEPLCAVFQKFTVAKKFMDKRGGEGGRQSHNFPSEVFLSHSAEKIRSGTIQCVTKSRYRKILCFRGLSHFYV